MRPEEDADGRLASGRERAEEGIGEDVQADPNGLEVTGPVGELAGQLAFWRARAAELEQQLAASRGRLRALAELLPPSLAVLVHGELDALRVGLVREDLLAGWEETVLLKPANVASELERLWNRLNEPPDS